ADRPPAPLPPDAGRDRRREELDHHLPGAGRHPEAVPDEVSSVNRQPTMHLADLDYALPAELIAQEPAPERTAARLLVLDRSRETLAHGSIAELPAHLRRGDLLVANDARVVPARVRGRRPSGGRLEVLFVRPVAEGVWDVLVRGAPRAGERVHLGDA